MRKKIIIGVGSLFLVLGLLAFFIPKSTYHEELVEAQAPRTPVYSSDKRPGSLLGRERMQNSVSDALDAELESLLPSDLKSYEEMPSTPIAYLGPKVLDEAVVAYFNQDMDSFSDIWKLDLSVDELQLLQKGNVVAIPNPMGSETNAFINVFINQVTVIESDDPVGDVADLSLAIGGQLATGQEFMDLSLAVIQHGDNRAVSGSFTTPDGTYNISSIDADPEKIYVMRYSPESDTFLSNDTAPPSMVK